MSMTEVKVDDILWQAMPWDVMGGVKSLGKKSSFYWNCCWI